MNRKEKLIYLAGIIDGEGMLKLCGQFHKKGNRKSIEARCDLVNTSKELIDWLHKNFKGHLLTVKREGNRKLQYRWILRYREMKLILPKIIPYLIIKKEGAKECLKLIMSRC